MKQLINQAWQWLELELDRWAAQDRRAEFWWRDDDATRPGPELERLVALGEKHRVALALAVIPAGLQAELADFLVSYPAVSVLQHGYAHQNHAATGQRKLELGGERTQAQTIADLKQGREILTRSFGGRFSPVLVPPWNRIDAGLSIRIAEIGFKGISTMKARRTRIPGLRQVNCHLDPIGWRHGGGFIGVYPAIAQIVQHLQAKRMGYRDADEATGFLTHHLVQNDAVWRFSGDLLEFVGKHPAANWLQASDIWP